MRNYNNLTIDDIIEIFSEHLNCPHDNCGQCKLYDDRVGCFRLRDMAMAKAIMILNEVK